MQLELTDELGSSPAHAMLRAYCLRDQRILGAVQSPLGLAGRFAGLSADAEKKAREEPTS